MEKEKIMLFHGSDHIVAKPTYGEGRTSNDYGRGFYCTEDLELAKEWACRSDLENKPIRYANRYFLRLPGLSIMNLDSQSGAILKWLAIVLAHRSVAINPRYLFNKENLIRNYLPDVSGIDAIIGWRADDRFFSYVRDFVQEGLSLDDLKEAAKLGKLGRQIVLISSKAFSQIEFLDAAPVKWKDFHFLAMEREGRANDYYNSIAQKNKYRGRGIRVTDLFDEAGKAKEFPEEEDNEEQSL